MNSPTLEETVSTYNSMLREAEDRQDEFEYNEQYEQLAEND